MISPFTSQIQTLQALCNSEGAARHRLTANDVAELKKTLIALQAMDQMRQTIFDAARKTDDTVWNGMADDLVRVLGLPVA